MDGTGISLIGATVIQNYKSGPKDLDISPTGLLVIAVILAVMVIGVITVDFCESRKIKGRANAKTHR